MFITISGEFAALTYFRNVYLLSVALCRVCEQCACTALSADWLLPGSVCNQSDGAVGGRMLETEYRLQRHGCIRTKITRFEIDLLSAVGLKKRSMPICVKMLKIDTDNRPGR